MLNLSRLAVVGTVGLLSVGAWTLPAAANELLGLQFTGTPTATLNSAPNGIAYGYNLLDTSTSISVNGLGEFVNGSLSNISASGGQMPISGGSTPAGDWVYLGSGAVPSSANSFGSSALISVEITAADASLVGSYWAFASITPYVLPAGDYWIAVVYGDDNTPYTSTSPVTTEAGISLLSGATCGLSSACSGTTGETFGPNFENDPVTPLPATLPLFAGGLGLIGFLAKRRKQNAKQGHAVA